MSLCFLLGLFIWAVFELVSHTAYRYAQPSWWRRLHNTDFSQQPHYRGRR